MLEVRNIKFAYKGKKNVLEDISFDLRQGECLCLLGPNGTGKSTLARCLLNLCKIKNGSISVNGVNMNTLSPNQRAKYLAYVSQSSNLTFPYKVHEVVKMGRVTHLKFGASLSRSDLDVVNKVLERLEIANLADNYFHELSGGQKKMVLVARALAQQAKYLIMDEPTANLDYSNQIKVLDVIKKLSLDNYGILMTSHFPDHAFLACNKVILMKDGVVKECGTPDEVVTSKNLSELYGTPVCVAPTEVRNNKDRQIKKVCVPIM
jgi:iron complex transport system ATP-binding protein